MAERNFWTIENNKVAKGVISFKWESGTSIQQKQRSCSHMHSALNVLYGLSKSLDISSASTSELGVQLSAFNLTLNGKSIECWYQGSKVFSIAGHMKHLYDADPMTAKRSMKEYNGQLIGFRLIDIDYPIKPRTVFYDYIYLRGLMQFKERDAILYYDAFTDVQATLDVDACQARSACIYKLLHMQDKLAILNNFDKFLKWHEEHVEVKYSVEPNCNPLQTVSPDTYKILDTYLPFAKNINDLLFSDLDPIGHDLYRAINKSKLKDIKHIIHTTGTIENLKSLKAMAVDVDNVLIVLHDYKGLCDCGKGYSAGYNIHKFFSDISNFFEGKRFFIVGDFCYLNDVLLKPTDVTNHYLCSKF